MQSALVGNAHLVQGGAEMIPAVLALLKKEGMDTRANPDIYTREYARFGIDDARELRDRASGRAIGPGRRVFIISTPTMTSDAQNALLKTFEEPSADAVFFLVVASPQTLLPTLRSRMQTLTLASVHGDELVDAGIFLAATGDKRLEMLKPLFEKDEDDKRDLRPILSFLSSVEEKLAKNPEGLRAVYRARKYIGDKGALIKPLLEQVALLTPKV